MDEEDVTRRENVRNLCPQMGTRGKRDGSRRVKPPSTTILPPHATTTPLSVPTFGANLLSRSLQIDLQSTRNLSIGLVLALDILFN
ncbi:hypothetical protein L1987_60358 [Smallanthus sonchifolius]|uniref:Uncharacterized protein n=1 Tax=Smallanthus sonchifolius TaxID=185202 RepID=A0ACB9D824_9ASTR|nr:hypothetical protein L1987_60358 [Smallanthus sonchifolius]